MLRPVRVEKVKAPPPPERPCRFCTLPLGSGKTRRGMHLPCMREFRERLAKK
jgi:hypothetical protein